MENAVSMGGLGLKVKLKLESRVKPKLKLELKTRIETSTSFYSRHSRKDDKSRAGERKSGKRGEGEEESLSSFSRPARFKFNLLIREQINFPTVNVKS